MKSILILLLFFFTSVSSSAQYSYDIVVDGKYYSMTESDLNDCFGNAFNTVVEYKYAKEHHFNLWADTFSEWKGLLRGKTIYIETIGNRVSRKSISGDLPPEYRGFKKNDEPSKGNPNDKNNISMRMSYILKYTGNEIVNKLTGKIIN